MKLIKILRDNGFLIGFTALTIATFEPTARWLAVSLVGYGFIAWQRRHK